MTPITESASLAGLCERLAKEDFVTVDTEFMRERTYWPKLCLIQLAGDNEAATIDTLADGLALEPLFELLSNPRIIKVFHAARQDIEIFFHLTGEIPAPVFDTQVAAMVSGFGDQVGYETLVSKLAGEQVDKSSRFTDWSKRPLTDKQIAYALADVVHLRPVYRKLKKKLDQTGRARWLDEEMAILTAPETYRMEPEDSWRRLKVRTTDSRFLSVAREVAAYREREAQTRDVPRNRVIRDEAITEIAAHRPRDAKALERIRAVPDGFARGRMGVAVLEAVERALALPEEDRLQVADKPNLPRGLGPVIDLLKVLLKMKCDEHNVAPKLIANVAELERIAADDEADVPALRGWRREVFGADALALKHGEVGLTIRKGRMALVRQNERA
ncbi:MAG: ribonuclease D [Rhodospirillaceae bacterium]|jgi:ribonuclease D|nr:ribonuclease D [Rhodospirillaceae bacterium]MBT6116312.1 ribonuclease D [Rhodospirillaceae bacterium]